MSEAVDCPDVEALAPEIALGIVSGSERASAIAHLGQCPVCSRLVDDLAAVADRLLLLAPEAEPSIGFESRVLSATAAASANGETPGPRFVPSARERPPRRRRLSLAAAAIAAALTLVAGGAGLLVGRAAHDHPATVRTAVAVAARGQATCRAFAYAAPGNDQAWVFVSLEAPREWTADYTVEVTTVGGGTPAAVGHFHLQDGTGALGTTVDVPASHLRAIRVLDASGALRYEAPFST